MRPGDQSHNDCQRDAPTREQEQAKQRIGAWSEELSHDLQDGPEDVEDAFVAH